MAYNQIRSRSWRGEHQSRSDGTHFDGRRSDDNRYFKSHKQHSNHNNRQVDCHKQKAQHRVNFKVSEAERAHRENQEMDRLYNMINAAKSRRFELLTSYNSEWDRVKRYHEDRTEELNRLGKEMGYQTNLILKAVNQLCRYSRRHKAMSLASDFLGEEMLRCNRIINSRQRYKEKVEAGRATYINSRGYVHSDTTQQTNYINTKRAEYNRMSAWKAHIDKYIL